MKILLIGNGFDLAHGLKTRYTDFLEFVKEVKNSNEGNDQYLEECKDLINENVWIIYFLNVYEERVKEGKENWIDFEMEISEKIKTMDSFSKRIKHCLDKHLSGSIERDEWTSLNILLKAISNEWGPISSVNINQIKVIKNRLLTDLNRMIRCLEIYLSKETEDKFIDKIPLFNELSIDHVLSFNYTNTFEKIYGNEDIEYDYIHGKARFKSDIDQCNLVLGIDEYLSDEEKDKNLEFIQFKKFYQRIYKQTGSHYKDWIYYDRFYDPNVTLYVYGHSLDITDKDILKELILNEYISTTIYYHNQESLQQLITNLVKIIGEENLIHYTGGEQAKICFKEYSGK